MFRCTDGYRPAAISESVTANLATHFAQKPLRRTIDMARRVGDLVDDGVVEWYGTSRSDEVVG